MKLVSALIVIVLGAVFALAQERSIDQEEFDQALMGTDQHKTKWQGQSYRTRVETFVTGVGSSNSDHSASIMVEKGPDRKVRSVLTSRSGGKSTTEEQVSIGDKTYSRTNGGPWVTKERKRAYVPDSKPNGADQVVTVSADAAYFALGERPYKEATATVYRKVENDKKVYSPTGVETTTICTTEYWLVDGLQRKETLACRHSRPTQTSTTDIVHSWDLDPTIEIKAP
jgi:hypothetical protein